MNDVAVTAPTKELFIKMAVAAWDTHCVRITKLLDELTDEQLAAETAPGRNTGIYLLGHLTAVTDSTMSLLGFGEKMHPGLEKPFLTSPDKSGNEMPSAQELRKLWKDVNARFSAAMASVTPDEWFMKHTAVSEEDFAKEPHRNRLNVLINRTNHQGYHLGQLVYLKSKK
jgi:DinB superfamily